MEVSKGCLLLHKSSRLESFSKFGVIFLDAVFHKFYFLHFFFFFLVWNVNVSPRDEFIFRFLRRFIVKKETQSLKLDSVLLDCMLLSCHVRVSEWTLILWLPECQGTPCSKQARCLKFKWLQRDSNPQPQPATLFKKRLCASLAKWLSVRLQTKWLWVRVPLQSFKRFTCLITLTWLI